MKYTYFFYCSETGLTKIGRTQYPQQRFNQLGGSKKLSVVGLIEGDVESKTHDVYSKDRREGEWFRLSKTQRDAIRTTHPCSTLPEGERSAFKAEAPLLEVPASKYQELQDLGKIAHEEAQNRARVKLMGGKITEVEIDLKTFSKQEVHTLRKSAEIAGVSLRDFLARVVMSSAEAQISAQQEVSV